MPQCASPRIVDILFSAGANFSLPIIIPRDGYDRHYCPPAITDIPLIGHYQKQYLEDISEYLLGGLSRDVATLGYNERSSLCLLLTEVCCGRSAELWGTWLQAHVLPADAVFSPGPLVDKIASIMTSKDLEDERSNCLIYNMLEQCFV